MENNFRKIYDKKSFEEWLARSVTSPVVVFKHSLTCPLSAQAYEEMSKLGIEVVLVEVQRAGELSRAIAEHVNIEHESPQVMVFRNGKPVWHASHFNVRAETVNGVIQQNS